MKRGQHFKQVPINIVGSSTFGRYPKINIEKTFNMFMSDNWLVDYAGYKSVIHTLGTEGRAIHASTKMNRLVAVVGNTVYLINIFYDQNNQMTFDTSVTTIGTLLTSSGDVFIAENNKPQIAISDGVAIYIYDPTLSPTFQTISTIDFTPGYIDFHDTYFICAASNDNFYSPPANNTWRLSDQNDGTVWPSDAAHIGLLQTKPDNIQAVVRFPSKGNMVLVMGETVSEPWFDVGYQLFPYQRSNSYNIDYGCLNPATIAYLDEYVVWLAQNEKTGPIIVYSTGSEFKKVTTDGIDFLFGSLTNPADSQAFMYRQDGHLFYHINFYTDNLSLFIDFLPNGEHKIYHACDENLNYFIANEVAFFNNQYYFLSKNNGNLYSFDTLFTTYDGAEIPRIRTCRNVRDPNQDYFIANDVGFTIETGETPFQEEDGGPIDWYTQDGMQVITQGNAIFFVTQDGDFLVDQSGNDNYLISQQIDITDFDDLIFQDDLVLYISPCVDLSISIDGGASFSSDFRYYLPGPGQRRSRLMWWQLGIANDMVCQFKFWGLGRFVATDGIMNIRQ